MNKHASLNRIYRLVWNETLNAYVPAAETARGRVKRSTRSLVAAVLALSATVAQAGPGGASGVVVTGGSGTITQSGSTTTITQSSQNLSLNRQIFNIAPSHRWTAKSYLAARLGSQSSLIHDPASARLWVELAKEF
jgi:hypothetical protein